LTAVTYNLHAPIFFQVFMFLISIILFYLSRKAITEIGKQIFLKFRNLLTQKLIGPLFYNYLLFFLSLFTIFYLPSLIPSEIKMGGSIINIFSHYIGYLFGLFVPIVIDKLKL
jgi:hypothetical protein